MSLRSPLYDVHVALGGRLVDFAGWDMPLQFSGVVAEHTAVRERAGLFDVSHLGKLMVEGPQEAAAALLDRTVTANVAGIKEWRARYSLVLNSAGGVVDDLFVYRRPDAYLVVPNAANTMAVLNAIEDERLAAEAAGEPAGAVRVTDARDRWAILALQGPGTRAIAAALLPGAVDLPLHAFGDYELGGTTVQVARTGYTGEFGFELFVPSANAPRVWDLLMKAGEGEGIMAVGLGARDTLRLEMGYPLHGHEISPELDPVSAGMSWAIDWTKPSFRGKEALDVIRAAGPGQRLVGLVAEGPGVPRAGQAVLAGAGPGRGPGLGGDDDQPVGMLTSGNFSPTLHTGIALGYVHPDLAEPGTMLNVDVRGKRLPVRVTRPPFVARGRAAAAT